MSFCVRQYYILILYTYAVALVFFFLLLFRPYHIRSDNNITTYYISTCVYVCDGRAGAKVKEREYEISSRETERERERESEGEREREDRTSAKRKTRCKWGHCRSEARAPNKRLTSRPSA